MQGAYVGSNGNKIGVLQRWWWWWRWWQWGYGNSINEAWVRGKGTMVPDQHRQGKGNAAMVSQQSDEGEGKWLGKGARQLSTQTGQKGYNGGAALK
jgi:hypothetical protein